MMCPIRSVGLSFKNIYRIGNKMFFNLTSIFLESGQSLGSSAENWIFYKNSIPDPQH
jgi:hypothetical protein